MNADSNQGFAASPRQIALEEKRIRLLAAAAATDLRVMEERTTTKTRNNKCVMISMSCVLTVTKLAWRPRQHHCAPHIEDDRVQKEGALQPRLVPLRVHVGGVHGPAQELLVEQDAADVLEQDAVCGSTQNGCSDQKMAMRVQCCIVFHQSSVLVTVRAKKKKNQTRKSSWSFCPHSGVICRIPVILAGIGGQNNKKTVGNHYGPPWYDVSSESGRDGKTSPLIVSFLAQV